MEYAVILFFVSTLLFCVWNHISLVWALLIGYGLFFSYGMYKGCTPRELFLQSWNKVRSIAAILVVFALIGMLSATWRACGTIPLIVQSSLHFLHPSYFLLLTFVLCALVSMLMGTAYGTAATVGIICMTMGNMLGLDPAYLGGAILSGAYFGDRMSPLSTTVFLVSMLTKTDVYANVKRMLRSMVLPLGITCLLYVFWGWQPHVPEVQLMVLDSFDKKFHLSWIVLSPAVLIIFLVVLKVQVRSVLACSTLLAAILCMTVQGMSFMELMKTLVYGFKSSDAAVGALFNGGGVLSMLSVAAIVGISSSYVGLFEVSHLLDSLKGRIHFLASKVGVFPALLLTSIITCAVACNQIMGIIVSTDLCKDMYEKVEDMAIPLENSAVVIAPLIPWSIASSVPFVTVGAPTSSIMYAAFLYVIPALALLGAVKQRFS